MTQVINSCNEIEKKGGHIFSESLKRNQTNTPIKKAIATEDIQAFIEHQPGFAHSLEALSRHFYGRVVKCDPRNPSERSLYDRIWKKSKNARINIQKKHKGNWVREQMVENGFGQPAHYTFVRRE